MNRPDVKDDNGLWIKSAGVKDNIRTLSFEMWTNMVSRCTAGGAYQTKNPSYLGCELSDEFSDFQGFTDWHTQQAGYALPTYELDKDLIGCGKVYSANNCVLIPHHLNTVFKYALGERTSGVYLDKKSGRLYSNITSFGKARRLGFFSAPEDAKHAFNVAKAAELTKWIAKINEEGIVLDMRILPKIEFLIAKLSKERN